jgi:hypothetical protein
VFLENIDELFIFFFCFLMSCEFSCLIFGNWKMPILAVLAPIAAITVWTRPYFFFSLAFLVCSCGLIQSWLGMFFSWISISRWRGGLFFLG